MKIALFQSHLVEAFSKYTHINLDTLKVQIPISSPSPLQTSGGNYKRQPWDPKPPRITDLAFRILSNRLGKEGIGTAKRGTVIGGSSTPMLSQDCQMIGEDRAQRVWARAPVSPGNVTDVTKDTGKMNAIKMGVGAPGPCPICKKRRATGSGIVPSSIGLRIPKSILAKKPDE